MPTRKKINPSTEQTAEIRSYLKKRIPGVSVTSGRGTASTWLTIKAPGGRQFTPNERKELREVYNLTQVGNNDKLVDVSPNQKNALIQHIRDLSVSKRGLKVRKLTSTSTGNSPKLKSANKFAIEDLKRSTPPGGRVIKTNDGVQLFIPESLWKNTNTGSKKLEY